MTETAVNQNRAMSSHNQPTYYQLLELHQGASVIQIRRAYWDLSKRYHPDTTNLPKQIATAKFQQINEAYATLSNPERRLSYDLKIGYSPFGVIQAPPSGNIPSRSYNWSKSAYLDASDRPLSAGEMFVLFILGLTLVGCLLLAIAIGLIRGDAIQTPVSISTSTPENIQYRSQESGDICQEKEIKINLLAQTQRLRRQNLSGKVV